MCPVFERYAPDIWEPGDSGDGSYPDDGGSFRSYFQATKPSGEKEENPKIQGLNPDI
jgi:hypothetical protein